MKYFLCGLVTGAIVMMWVSYFRVMSIVAEHALRWWYLPATMLVIPGMVVITLVLVLATWNAIRK